MPETITLEDGTTREVLTEQEQTDLQAGHDANITKRDAVNEFNSIKEGLELKEGESIEDKLQEMKDAVNPNFKGMREKIKAVTDAAKAKGVEFDADGNVAAENKQLTAEDVRKQVEDVVSSNQNKSFKEKALSTYQESDAKTIGSVFDKLEALGSDPVENMKLAIGKVFPETNVSQLDLARQALGGGAPRQTDKKDVSNDLKSFGANFGLEADDFKN